jgi:hypothetical protein
MPPQTAERDDGHGDTQGYKLGFPLWEAREGAQHQIFSTSSEPLEKPPLHELQATRKATSND